MKPHVPTLTAALLLCLIPAAACAGGVPGAAPMPSVSGTPAAQEQPALPTAAPATLAPPVATGAVVNMRPELFRGVIAAVPFVDAVTTMLDSSIPLTTFEWDEWGDPRKPEFFDYMLSYSPYDQVSRQAYPHMLVTTGLHDSQVQYWEPAKWVARLRTMKTDDNALLMKTNMEAGHGGASGRYQRWREIAFEYAFLLDLAGLAEAEPRVAGQ
jgi:hypothetical protein